MSRTTLSATAFFAGVAAFAVAQADVAAAPRFASNHTAQGPVTSTSVTGRVVDMNKRPLPAMVHVRNDPRSSQVPPSVVPTDGQGRFTITARLEGVSTLEVEVGNLKVIPRQF